jgi:hypothetical protein
LAVGDADAGDLVPHGVGLNRDAFGWMVEVYTGVDAFLQEELGEFERISGEFSYVNTIENHLVHPQVGRREWCNLDWA